MHARAEFLFIAMLLAMTPVHGAAPRLAGKAAVAPRQPAMLQTLYDQTARDTGIAVVSQNFETDFDVYDCFAADDFTVPDGGRWNIRQVTILGTYFSGEGPSSSQNVVFYKDKRGLPGRLVVSYLVDGIDDGNGSFVIALDKGLKLKPGHYWISVQSNQDFSSVGQWGWLTSDVVVNRSSAFRNPGDGLTTGCVDWAREKRCVPVVEGDHLFALAGRVFGDQ